MGRGFFGQDPEQTDSSSTSHISQEHTVFLKAVKKEREKTETDPLTCCPRSEYPHKRSSAASEEDEEDFSWPISPVLSCPSYFALHDTQRYSELKEGSVAALGRERQTGSVSHLQEQQAIVANSKAGDLMTRHKGNTRKAAIKHHFIHPQITINSSQLPLLSN